MREAQIANYTNPNQLYNSCHFVAWGLAQRLQRLGWHNLKYRFLPPEVHSIMVHPMDMQIELEEAFTREMFVPGGFLHEVPLNHYIIFENPTFLINVGYLWHHFAISDDFGYSEYARMLELAKKEAKIAKTEANSSGVATTKSSPTEVQAEGPTNQE